MAVAEAGVNDWAAGLWAPQEKFGPAKGEPFLLCQEGKAPESIRVPLIQLHLPKLGTEVLWAGKAANGCCSEIMPRNSSSLFVTTTAKLKLCSLAQNDILYKITFSRWKANAANPRPGVSFI